MNKVFNDLFDIMWRDAFFADSPFLSPKSPNPKLSYPVNMFTLDDNLCFEVAAIGLDKEDIEISLEGRTLNVRTKNKTETKQACYYHRNIKDSIFSLQFLIPNEFDIDKTDLKLEKGLFSITIPKAESMKPKLLSIS